MSFFTSPYSIEWVYPKAKPGIEIGMIIASNMNVRRINYESLVISFATLLD